MSAFSDFNREIRWSMVVSILMILAGCLAIIVPPISGIAVTLFVAWLLILSGVAHWAYTWDRRQQPGIWWGWLLGVLFVVVGIRMLMFPVAALASLTLLLGIYLLVNAGLEFSLAFRLRRQNGWGWVLVDGLVSLALAVLILHRWPHNALWVIGLLVGFSILFAGISRFMLSLAARHTAKSLEEPAPG
ncbi:MAG TPA: DUF308 domain-containing protein [Candidatus Sulfotelmatobacter sp.]|nr:DUF308 domain-containing protein [Candidatus Sulfotelmatobacter sp.]